MQTITGSILNANELVLSHGFEQLLDGVSFQLEAGQKVGLVGRNGCGKSSLLKLLTRRDLPNSGTVTVTKGVRIGYLPQDFE